MMPEPEDEPPVILLPDVSPRSSIRRLFDRIDALPPSNISTAFIFVLLFLVNAAFADISQDDPGRYWQMYALVNVGYLSLISILMSTGLTLFSDRMTFGQILSSVCAKFLFVAALFIMIGLVIAFVFLFLLFTIAGPNMG